MNERAESKRRLRRAAPWFLLIGACKAAPAADLDAAGHAVQQGHAAIARPARLSTTTGSFPGLVQPNPPLLPVTAGGTKLVASDSTVNGFLGSGLVFSQGELFAGSWGAMELGLSKGAVYPFTRAALAWQEQPRLLAGDRASGDHFGWSVASTADRLVVGAESAGTGDGAGYVFVRSAAGWAEEATLIPTAVAAGDRVGMKTALTADTAFLGSYNHDALGADSGAVFVFQRSAESWSEAPTLFADEGAAGDFFGWSIAGEQQTVVVGAFRHANSGGAVYVFERTASSWSQAQKLSPSDGASGDQFGSSVSLDGSQLLVGADGHGVGGAAYVFTRSAGAFSEAGKLVPDDPAASAYFGSDLALEGERALIAARGDASAGAYTGAAYLFARSANLWLQEQKVLAPDASNSHQFASEVALDGDTAAVAAYGDDQGGRDAGAVYVFGVKAGGKDCTDGGQCTSGFCVDGRCCDGACDGACERCDLGGSEGQCSPIADNAVGDASCGPYLCDGVGRLCPQRCNIHADCADSHHCAAEQCVAKSAIGGGCSSASSCQSGACVAGFCCDGDCSGGCERCDVEGSEGRCGAFANGVANEAACGGYLCDGSAGACPQSCEADAQCGPSYHCSAGSCMPDAAPGEACEDGAMCQTDACTDGVCCVSQACAPYRCGAAGVCHPSCTSAAQCASGYGCSSVGRCERLDGEESNDAGGCSTSGPSSDSSVWWPILLILPLGRRRRRHKGWMAAGQ